MTFDASSVKDFLFPVEKWGIEKVRTTAVCMTTTMLMTWLICNKLIPNKSEESILKEKEIM